MKKAGIFLFCFALFFFALAYLAVTFLASSLIANASKTDIALIYFPTRFFPSGTLDLCSHILHAIHAWILWPSYGHLASDFIIAFLRKRRIEGFSGITCSMPWQKKSFKWYFHFPFYHQYLELALNVVLSICWYETHSELSCCWWSSGERWQFLWNLCSVEWQTGNVSSLPFAIFSPTYLPFSSALICLPLVTV